MSRPVPPHVAFTGLAVVFAAFFVAAGAPTPLLSLQQQAWGFSASLLTIAFSVYALSLLVALLVAGSLSDHLGRRPVLLVSIAAELVSMVTLVLAPNIGWIVVGRAIQGLATGLATSVFSVAIVEQASPHRRPLAGSLATASVAGGLGIVTLIAGAAVQLSTNANTWVFATLAAVMAAALVFVLCLQETAARRAFGGQLRIIAPRVQVHERAGVIANIYTVAYLAFGVPVAVAGQLVRLWGLSVTYQLYAAVVVVVAAVGVATQVSRARHDAMARRAPEHHVTPGAAGSRG